MRRVLYNGRLRSELVLRGEVGLPYAGAPRSHLRGFRLRETPTVEKSPQDTGPYFLAGQTLERELSCLHSAQNPLRWCTSGL